MNPYSWTKNKWRKWNEANRHVVVHAINFMWFSIACPLYNLCTTKCTYHNFSKSYESWEQIRLSVGYKEYYRLASVGILGKKSKPRVGKLGWHGNFDMEFERNTLGYFVQNPVCGFFELF